MKCDKVKDILFTVYFDGELPDSDRIIIDKHLKSCSDCRALASGIKSACIDVFNGVDNKIPVPDGIFDVLVREAQKSTLLERIYEYLKHIFTFPKVLVPAFAGIAIAFLLLTYDADNTINTSEVNSSDGEEYFSYVFNGEDTQPEDIEYVSVEFGSVIEEYLF